MNTKDKILEKSIELFNNQGVHNVGVRDVARALEMSPGNVSYHFPKKEDLILALMEKMSEGNNFCLEAYGQKEASLLSFIALYEGLFTNQFAYRGLLIGNTEFEDVLRNRYAYKKTYEKRVHQLQNILIGLRNKGLLHLSEPDQKMFLAFLTFFGRSWIHESFIYQQNDSAKETIQHYINLLKWQLSLIATEEGKLQLAQLA
ncbi:MAG TPA: TetR/AcrR family transcriptional regulator [Haliscomenobacter sp.]|uniref:Regulatory protein TetR n=1 Tax=Haliscomenobacter hydrossis (strain ATCC 27775 / DSM 1100 / LMG 10767 / O) TaxID=760192 RepID=F4KQQ5_HALH1|nr:MULTISPECIES: TetR/AcrR family transcriptional regulator [Haliscomenobacter]AEE51028.1 regulatory protein TetR [Haliscomenobacter hydrossis DSM 1100]HOY21429.1 TetR/AcrR family transcriptional regulator [Haliscomenobacter sp.]